MRTVLLSGIIGLLLICSCGRQGDGEQAALVGRVTMDEVYAACPRFRQVAEETELDSSLVRRLADVDRPIAALVFLGTWCSDSEEHVPPFDLLLRAAANPRLTVAYYGVDRNKDDGLGLARQYGLTRVPTFILLEDGREIGRIVETPTVSIGDDLIDILHGEN